MSCCISWFVWAVVVSVSLYELLLYQLVCMSCCCVSWFVLVLAMLVVIYKLLLYRLLMCQL